MRNSPRRRGSRIRLALVGLGLVMVCFGFWTVFASEDAYRVAFSSSGQECEGEALTLSQGDGRPLSCNLYETGTRPFTVSERRQVVGLAGQLGQDGLSESDRAQVRALVAQIAAANGDPGIADDRILSAGRFAFVAGGLLVLLPLYAGLNRGTG